LGGQEFELRPLTTGQFLELIYIASDALPAALKAWSASPDAYSLVTVLLNHLDNEKALELISLFLPVSREWIEENTTPDELYRVMKISIGLNDWSEILQAILVFDVFEFSEVVGLWQTAASASQKNT